MCCVPRIIPTAAAIGVAKLHVDPLDIIAAGVVRAGVVAVRIRVACCGGAGQRVVTVGIVTLTVDQFALLGERRILVQIVAQLCGLRHHLAVRVCAGQATQVSSLAGAHAGHEKAHGLRGRLLPATTALPAAAAAATAATLPTAGGWCTSGGGAALPVA